MHYQIKPSEEAKLIRCTMGSIYDVIVDLRPDSPTFKQYIGIELTASNRTIFYVPEGFAHGFLVLSEVAEFQYKCSDFFSMKDERGLPWNDPAIGIQWPLEGLDPLLSDRDREWLPLRETVDADLPVYAP